ncbi:MAG: M24 family metallopeptidase [Fretibacterium sp.]|nr:M24 family metallopeptidase [Fretibacterium sp.]
MKGTRYISGQELTRRRQRVREEMRRAGAGVLVAFGSPQLMARGLLRWLADWPTPVFEEYLVMPLEGPVTLFVHDASEAEFAGACCAADEVRVIPAADYVSDPCRGAAELVRALGAERAATAGRGMSAAFRASLAQNLAGTKLISLDLRLERLRMVKSQEEVRLSEAAVKLNEEVFRHYAGLVKPGGRELDAVAEASRFALSLGAEELYWMSASGPVPGLALMAQARERTHIWEKRDCHCIILEHAAAGGHMGETTHLISLGRPKEEYARAFAAVGEAQLAAAGKIRPGARVGELAAAAEEALRGCGYDGCFTPGGAIGHGQGADVWEIPCIAAGNETLIEPGMRFNLHPSVRLGDGPAGSLRQGAVITSCDCWISEESGARRLSSLPREIIEV